MANGHFGTELDYFVEYLSSTIVKNSFQTYFALKIIYAQWKNSMK